ncbi:hypothetical protein CcCBS67573_g08786 [Chytriomyces confervae]|uniref:Uncharacterized protein n=1 Tax=Chytriomyces confervae TaxID=246404 RepID=A0A507EI20_9FUNG|nr:hypothetical protein CcCBS67573_g08786 [Chytriomyces confervae]
MSEWHDAPEDWSSPPSRPATAQPAEHPVTVEDVEAAEMNPWADRTQQQQQNHNEPTKTETVLVDNNLPNTIPFDTANVSTENLETPPLVFADLDVGNESIHDGNTDPWGVPIAPFRPQPIESIASTTPSSQQMQSDAPNSMVFWKKFKGPFLPSEAISIGRDTDGSSLFATRAPWKGGLHVGKGRNNGGCYISWGGKEVLLGHEAEYEVLCGVAEGIEWIPQNGLVSAGLVSGDRLIEGGHEENGTPLFIGFCETYFHGTQVGKCGPHISGVNYPYAGKECNVKQYKIAAYARVLEMDDTTTDDPSIVESESTAQYSTEALSSGAPIVYWRAASKTLPHDAIRLGRDIDGTPLYAGRAKVSGGGVQVGKIRGGEACYIPYGGRELTFKKGFEVLCGDSRVIDLEEVEGKIPLMKIADLKPIEAGSEANGMPLYIAIHEAFGTIQIGKCSPSLPGCHFSYNGKEHIGAKFRMVVYH